MSHNTPALRKAIIVGGAGGMGRWAVRGIVKLGSVEELLVADIDLARAQKIADEVGPTATAVRLDATDPVAMREAFADCDVVLNTMGPFSKFARPILEAAIDGGCDYLDIDDDWESTIEAFELDAEARAKGVRVVKGIGGSPGLSNLAAALVANRLDKVTDIFTGWSMRGAVLVEEADYPAVGAASAAVEHWLIQISGKIRAFRDGAEKEIEPLVRTNLLYPGKGPVSAYTVGHPEAITLPRYFPTVVNSTNLTSGPSWLFNHARAVAAEFDAGTLSLADGASKLENIPAPPADAPREPRDPLAPVWALAQGERNGEPLAISVEMASAAPGMMGGGTGTALAAGLELLRQGRISAPGVNAPEGCIDPLEFFEVYLQFVEPKVSSVEDLLVIHEGPIS